MQRATACTRGTSSITGKFLIGQVRGNEDPMAVSQILRPGSLIDAVKGCLTPDLVRSASSLVGEPEAATRQTLNSAVPSVLSGLTNLVSSSDGANTLAGLIRDAGVWPAVVQSRCQS